MTIHYRGQLSKTPGRTPCDVISPQAVTTRWMPVDCPECRILGLLGLRLTMIGDGVTEGVVEEVIDYYVGIGWSDTEPPDRKTYDELETQWKAA